MNFAGRVVVVLGPTASGKSDVAMAVATENPNVEIVACDAMQVDRGMDVGTAKPTSADRESVPHHGLDLVEPRDRFTVSDFQTAGRRAIQDIHSRGHVALVVAGTGLYLTALIDDLSFPGEWPDVRAELERISDTAGLLRRLAELDPEAAEKIEPGNRRRIIRALEVCIGSGKKFSATGPGTDAYPPNGVPQIGILWEREKLARRVTERVHRMMERGFEAEARNIFEKRSPSHTAAQALGYRELFAHFRGECSLERAVADMITHTKQFAVRQERWFRRDPRIEWVRVDEDPVVEVAPIVARHCS
ncbi:MAG: tRNA (adenosine(37)-N6)-dimethylallyltransferase MiaA [Ilumatobacteraceae bacterium]